MMKKGFIYILMLAFCCQVGLSQTKSNTSQPHVISLEVETLAASKRKIKAGDPELMTAYKTLLKEADKALAFGPVSVMEKTNYPPSGNKHDYMSLAPYHWPDPSKVDGLPYIRKDGQTNPEVKEYKDKEYMPQLCDKINKLSLAYYFSDDNKYAEHAGRLIRVWFLDTATRMNPNLNYGQAIKGVNTGRGAGMIDVRHLIKVIDAVGLLKGTKYWKTSDQSGMKSWFTEFLNWMHTSKNGKDEMNAPNNHGAWYDALRLSISLFVDSMALAREIVYNAQARLDKQMDVEGKFPLEMARTTSLHYTVFVMDAFFNIALMADKTGVDFWEYKNPAGKSLQKAFDELLPYLSKKKEWEGPQIKEFNFEEGIRLLALAYAKLGCKNCRDFIREIVGDKEPRLLINLLY